jgi:hypothetical protein
MDYRCARGAFIDNGNAHGSLCTATKRGSIARVDLREQTAGVGHIGQRYLNEQHLSRRLARQISACYTEATFKLLIMHYL